jgi:hypothetical protein
LPVLKRIALVGNGVVDSSAGNVIDAHDLVVRFNACTSCGSAGERTGVIVLANAGHPGRAFASGETPINAGALRSDPCFWLAKPPLIHSIERRRHRAYKVLVARKPWYYPHTWDDYTDAIVERIGSRPWSCIEALTYWQAMGALVVRGASSLQMPSSGMLALFHIRRRLWPARVTLFGFSHQGWDGHPWEAERAQVSEWRDWVNYPSSAPHR